MFHYSWSKFVQQLRQGWSWFLPDLSSTDCSSRYLCFMIRSGLAYNYKLVYIILSFPYLVTRIGLVDSLEMCCLINVKYSYPSQSHLHRLLKLNNSEEYNLDIISLKLWFVTDLFYQSEWFKLAAVWSVQYWNIKTPTYLRTDFILIFWMNQPVSCNTIQSSL